MITHLRISRIANPVYKSSCFWRGEEKTWTLQGNKQQLKTPAGLSKVISEKSNQTLWDLLSFEYARLAEGIVLGLQPLINSLVISKLEDIILHKN